MHVRPYVYVYVLHTKAQHSVGCNVVYDAHSVLECYKRGDTLGGHPSVGVQIPRITIHYKYITYKRAYIYIDAC